MKITIAFFLGLIFLNCSSTKEIIGTYKGKNYFGVSQLDIKKDNTFTYKIDRAMMTDSVDGYYTKDGKQVRLILTTKDIEITKVQLPKQNQVNGINISFIEPHGLNHKNFEGDTLIINDRKITLNQFNNYKMVIDCNDEILYRSESKVKIDSLKCGASYYLKVYKRSIHKMIPDTIDLDFSKSHKIELGSFILTK